MLQRNITIYSLAMLVSVAVFSCGDRHLNDDDSVIFPPKFSEIRNRIITPKCANCHGALVSYKEFSEEAKTGGIVSIVKSGEMPKYGQPLGTAEINAIEAWVKAGAKND